MVLIRFRKKICEFLKIRFDYANIGTFFIKIVNILKVYDKSILIKLDSLKIFTIYTFFSDVKPVFGEICIIKWIL